MEPLEGRDGGPKDRIRTKELRHLLTTVSMQS